MIIFSLPEQERIGSVLKMCFCMFLLGRRVGFSLIAPLHLKNDLPFRDSNKGNVVTSQFSLQIFTEL